MEEDLKRRRFEELRNFWTECDELIYGHAGSEMTCDARRRIAKEMYRAMVEDYRHILQADKDLREAEAAARQMRTLIRIPAAANADP